MKIPLPRNRELVIRNDAFRHPIDAARNRLPGPAVQVRPRTQNAPVAPRNTAVPAPPALHLGAAFAGGQAASLVTDFNTSLATAEQARQKARQDAQAATLKNFLDSFSALQKVETMPVPRHVAALPPPWMQPGYKTTQEDWAEYDRKFAQTYAKDEPSRYEREIDHDAMKVRLEKAVCKWGDAALTAMPQQDLMAVHLYTAEWYAGMKKALLGGVPHYKRKYDLALKAMRSGLNRMRDAGYAYAGPGVHYRWNEKDEFEAAFKDGGVYQNPNFVSTSPDIERWTWHGNIRLDINMLSGVEVTPLNVTEEREVVIPPGAVFRLKVDVWDPPGYKKGPGLDFWRKVTMTEIDPATMPPNAESPLLDLQRVKDDVKLPGVGENLRGYFYAAGRAFQFITPHGHRGATAYPLSNDPATEWFVRPSLG